MSLILTSCRLINFYCYLLNIFCFKSIHNLQTKLHTLIYWHKFSNLNLNRRNIPVAFTTTYFFGTATRTYIRCTISRPKLQNNLQKKINIIINFFLHRSFTNNSTRPLVYIVTPLSPIQFRNKPEFQRKKLFVCVDFVIIYLFFLFAKD